MPLGLPKLAPTVKSLEAVLVSTSSDDILFDSWSRDGSILTNEDAAGYLGLFVRTRIEVLEALGFKLGPLQASIETDGRIILFRHIEDQFHLIFIFNANLPYGLARMQAEKLKSVLSEKLLDPPRPVTPIENTQPISPPKPLPDTLHSQTRTHEAPATGLKTSGSQPDILSEISPEHSDAHLLGHDVTDDASVPADDTLFFDRDFPEDTLTPVVNEDVVLTIGHIEPDHFEPDTSLTTTPPQVTPIADNSSPPAEEGTSMSTHYTIQQETVVVSSTFEGDAQSLQVMQKQQQIQRELLAERLRMTYEGGRPDETPVDTPTERRRGSAIIGKQRMENEGGSVPTHPVDTPTQSDNHAQDHTAKSRMANEGGSVRQQPVDTATEQRSHGQTESTGQRMIDEGGHSYTLSEYARAHVPYHEQDIVSSVRSGSAPITRAQTLIDYVTANVSNPNTAHARLAVHSHVPLELILSPSSLTPEQVGQLEDAARIILGVSELPV